MIERASRTVNGYEGCIAAVDRDGRIIWLRTHIAMTGSVSLCMRQQNGKEMRGRHSVYRTKVLYAAVGSTVRVALITSPDVPTYFLPD
jgi:hypothetical protein